jgi:hypothetical protein
VRIQGNEVVMREPKVSVFFYGSYMNREVLGEVGLAPESLEVARLSGHDIRVEPLANVVPSETHSIYGLLATATHQELERLYAHARDVLGGVYVPHPVVVQTLEGKLVPALCYIAPVMERRPASGEYLDRILGPATEHGFPAWYLGRIESFRRGPEARGAPALEVVRKRFESPDEMRHLTKGRFEIVRLGDMTIGRATYEPGWKWSEHVGPAVGAARCAVEHVGMVVRGTATAAFDDGRVVELRAGELFHIPSIPHDSWVVGDEPYVSIHFLGAEKYARSS